MQRKNNFEKRGYQPIGNKGKFGYQPIHHDPSASTQQGNTVSGGKTSFPPEGSDEEDA